MQSLNKNAAPLPEISWINGASQTRSAPARCADEKIAAPEPASANQTARPPNRPAQREGFTHRFVALRNQLLSAASLSRTDVRSWALHPGGRRILEALAEALDLDGPAVGPSLDVLRRAGNMSSGAVFFVIERLLREGCGAEPLVALGFGPGLTLEGAVLAPGYAPADRGLR